MGASCFVQAGVLRLENGAVLPGELVSIGPKKLVWNADKIGNVSIEKSDVLSLQSDRKAPIELGQRSTEFKDCLLEVRKSQWSANCAKEQLHSLASSGLRVPPPATGSTGKFTTALDVDRGANPSDEITVNLKARWNRPGYRHNVYLDVDYEETDGETTDDDADANYQYDLLRDNGWFWFGRGRYYRDEFESLREVYAGGGGIGRDIKPAQDLAISLQAGPALMYYYFEDKDGQLEPGSSMMWTMTWQTHWHDVEVSHSGELGWVFAISDGYLFQSKTALTLPLYKGLVAELRLEYDRAGVSVGSNGDYDLEWVMALGYNW